jgi:hypothetical protein
MTQCENDLNDLLATLRDQEKAAVPVVVEPQGHDELSNSNSDPVNITTTTDAPLQDVSILVSDVSDLPSANQLDQTLF